MTDSAAVDRVRAAGRRMFDEIYATSPAICVVHPVSRLRCVVLPLYASTMWALRTVAHEGNVTSVAGFAARQLVEEAARWDWAADAGLSENEKVRRGNGLMRDMRRSRRRVLRAAAAAGFHEAQISAFVKPGGYDVVDLSEGSVEGEPVPMSPAEALGRIRVNGPEGPGWLITAYSVLSQLTHQTPLGVLHGYESNGADISAGSLSGPMEALAIDTAVTAASRLLWCIGTLLIGAMWGSDRARFDLDAYYEWRMVARRHADAVHQLAAPIHGIFGPDHEPFRTLGRNEPCLCRSARKAKHCHGSVR
ncbi:MAG: SEC-C metal-binding domain-containing protein [Actinomycetota bacterium]|nr:SEC-C metal-binding domain-containing protein [Actinomycetota bacterium]